MQIYVHRYLKKPFTDKQTHPTYTNTTTKQAKTRAWGQVEDDKVEEEEEEEKHYVPYYL